MKTIQITLNDLQYEFVQEEMKRLAMTKPTSYIRRMIEREISNEKGNLTEAINHILANSRDTNRRVRIIEEMMNHETQEVKPKHLIPIKMSKSRTYQEAELNVKKELKRLREVKLNNLHRKGDANE